MRFQVGDIVRVKRGVTDNYLKNCEDRQFTVVEIKTRAGYSYPIYTEYNDRRKQFKEEELRLVRRAG